MQSPFHRSQAHQAHSDKSVVHCTLYTVCTYYSLLLRIEISIDGNIFRLLMYTFCSTIMRRTSTKISILYKDQTRKKTHKLTQKQMDSQVINAVYFASFPRVLGRCVQSIVSKNKQYLFSFFCFSFFVLFVVTVVNVVIAFSMGISSKIEIPKLTHSIYARNIRREFSLLYV